MRALTAAEILRVWELGAARLPLERALLVLSAAAPDEPSDALAALPIGARDRRLLELRARTFGDEMALFARCPSCEEPVELALRPSELASAAAGAEGPHVLTTPNSVLRYRLPSSRDLAAVEGQADAARLLVRRCVLDASVDGLPVAADALPDALCEAVGAAMADADPDAEIRLDLGCPACGHRWPMLFDIAAVVWADVARQGSRLLQEVDALARTYGWREEEVLALSAQRRALYVEMALS